MSKGIIHMNRRAFLISGSSLIALPVLESLIPSNARAATADPKRFVAMYLPNGTYMKPNRGANWFPTNAGVLSSGNLPVTFQPFAGNISDFSILRGINNPDQSTSFGGDHSRAISGFLTCAPSTSDSSQCTITGDSFDQILAPRLGGKPTLNMCGGAIGDQRADNTAFPYGENLVYANGQAKRPYRNPVSLFNAMFAQITGGTVTTPVATATLVRNGSILDNAVDNIRSLQSELGKRDVEQLEDFLSRFRALETKYRNQGTGGGTTQPSICQPMAAPVAGLNNEDYYGNMTNFPERLKAFCDMLVLAFRCDLVRSATLAFDTEAAGRRFKNRIPSNLLYQNANMNEEESHIGMSHYGDDAAKQARCISRDRFYLSYVMYVINELKKANDPSGSSILDNTIILSGHGIADGNHDTGGIYDIGMPLILGGGRNMIHPGNFFDLKTRAMKDLLFTINSKLGAGLGNFRGSTTVLGV